MFQTKYFIIITIIICLFIFYYIYEEISNIKNTLLTTYQKTMSLDRTVLIHEKKFNDAFKKTIHEIESPIFSMTYQSDVGRKHDGDLVEYAKLSENDIPGIMEILKMRRLNYQHGKNDKKYTVPTGELSDIKEIPKPIESDTFDLGIINFLNPKKNKCIDLNIKNNETRILNGNVVKSISESLHPNKNYSDNSLSEITNVKSQKNVSEITTTIPKKKKKKNVSKSENKKYRL